MARPSVRAFTHGPRRRRRGLVPDRVVMGPSCARRWSQPRASGGGSDDGRNVARDDRAGPPSRRAGRGHALRPGLLAPELVLSDAVRLGGAHDEGGDEGHRPADAYGRRAWRDHVRLLLPARIADEDGALHRDGTLTLALILPRLRDAPGAARTQQRTEGTFEFIWSPPAPRSCPGSVHVRAVHGASPPYRGCVLALPSSPWRARCRPPELSRRRSFRRRSSARSCFGHRRVRHGARDRSAVVMNLITNSLESSSCRLLRRSCTRRPTCRRGFQKVHDVLPFEHTWRPSSARGSPTGSSATSPARTRCSLACIVVGRALTAFVVGRALADFLLTCTGPPPSEEV